MDADNPNNTTSTPPPRQTSPSWLERLLSQLFENRLLVFPAASSIPAAHPHSHPHPHQQPHCTRTSDTANFFAAPPTPHIPATHALPAMAEDAVRFCVEDTVGLKSDKYMVGVVDRSFGDVDSHEPRPQRDYGEDIECDSSIPRVQFSKFLKTGIPPRGTVLVSWQTQFKTELITEASLDLLDRALYVGDVVKRNAKHPMSGTVIGTKATCTLFPATMFNGGQLTTALTEESSIRGVPADELINVHEYVEGALVVYNDWIGRIDQVRDEVAVKLANNSVVIVENPDELDNDDTMLDRISVGDTVKTKKMNLRRGRWIYGAYEPNVRAEGMVVETRTTEVDVHWLAKRFVGSSILSHGPEPAPTLNTDDLEDPSFYVYDASRGAVATLPVAPNGEDPSYHVTEIAVGDRVRFKDLAGAAVKYDGSRSLPNGQPQGKLTKLARTETLGYDMNVYLVMQTHTQVTVQWQDLSNVEDDDEVWPGEIVCTKEQRTEKDPDTTWTFEPARVGVVQSVKPRDRIATVRWFQHSRIHFLGDDLIPPSNTGPLCEGTEDVSLYDIRSTPSLTRRRGDFVLIHPDAVPGVRNIHSQGPDWFGEVIDLGLDGKVTVRLGAAKPVVDVRVAAERVTLVYSSDMDNHMFDMPTLEGESVEDSDEDGSDFDTASFNEMWIEYEGMDGEPIGTSNEEDWSTEDEDDDNDSMPDLETPDGVETSNTTPEMHSDNEHKVPEGGILRTDEAIEESSGPMDVDDPPISIPKSNEPTLTANESLSSFLILDTAPPSNHHYLDTPTASSSTFTRRIAKEHKILRNSLPPGIFVRTWESRLDLIRVLMIGPSDTPYEYAPFVIDFHLDSSYPQVPPEAFFHSWTNGDGPVNPNLYEDGKICLSLLGTWHADERNEGWSPAKSTLLQVLVSIMGLVLVKEPYYNEAGYDVHRQAPETKLSSALYTERAYFRARAFIVRALTSEVDPFAEEIKYLYLSKSDGAPRLLDLAIAASVAILERSEMAEDGAERDGLRRISLGAVVMLRRQVAKLEALQAENK
jgi:ubiquitin-conjugating enzyme E2 O